MVYNKILGIKMIVQNGDSVIVKHSGLCYEEGDFKFVVGANKILKGINDAVIGRELGVEFTVHIDKEDLWYGFYESAGITEDREHDDVSLDLTMTVISIER